MPMTINFTTGKGNEMSNGLKIGKKTNITWFRKGKIRTPGTEVHQKLSYQQVCCIGEELIRFEKVYVQRRKGILLLVTTISEQINFTHLSR